MFEKLFQKIRSLFKQERSQDEEPVEDLERLERLEVLKEPQIQKATRKSVEVFDIPQIGIREEIEIRERFMPKPIVHRRKLPPASPSPASCHHDAIGKFMKKSGKGKLSKSYRKQVKGSKNIEIEEVEQ